jgi:hypothetical protein
MSDLLGIPGDVLLFAFCNCHSRAVWTFAFQRSDSVWACGFYAHPHPQPQAALGLRHLLSASHHVLALLLCNAHGAQRVVRHVHMQRAARSPMRCVWCSNTPLSLSISLSLTLVSSHTPALSLSLSLSLPLRCDARVARSLRCGAHAVRRAAKVITTASTTFIEATPSGHPIHQRWGELPCECGCHPQRVAT